MTNVEGSMNLETDLSFHATKLLNVSADDFAVILKYHNVSQKALEDMIKNIKDWYEKQPHLPKGYLHDRLITGHLIARGFSIERVKEKIDNCLLAKTKMAEILCDRDPLNPHFEKCLRRGYWVSFPKKTPDNYRITIFRAFLDDPTALTDMLKVAAMILEYRFWNDVYLGDIWIVDFTNVNVSHALQMTPVVISKLMFYLTGCFGARVRAINLVNLPSFASAGLTLFKKAMKTKLVQRLHLHSKIEDALEKFPSEIIPKDYGGDEISLQEITDEWVKTLQSKQWRQYFIEEDYKLTDESKRVTKTEADERFGLVGSFRNLDVD